MTWPNEPPGWTVVTDYDMHALNDGGWLNAYPEDITSGQVSVINDPTAPLSPPAVWQLYYARGNASLCGSGPGTEYYTLGQPARRLYYGAWVKFSNPFSFPTSDPEVHTSYALAQSGNGQIVLDMQNDGDVRLVAEFPAGTQNFYSIASPHWALGVWHQIEMLFNYLDGTAKVWVNGVLTINATGVPYPSDAGFSEVQVTGTWGGCIPPDAPAFDGWIWYDHVHISVPT